MTEKKQTGPTGPVSIMVLILIVDDEEDIRDIFELIIRGRSVQSGSKTWTIEKVFQAKSVPDARAVMAKMPRPPELVLCDRTMGTPETGEVLIEELAQMADPPKVIFITGDSLATIQQFLMRMGKTYPNFRLEYLAKPLGPRELRAAVDRILVS